MGVEARTEALVIRSVMALVLAGIVVALVLVYVDRRLARIEHTVEGRP